MNTTAEAEIQKYGQSRMNMNGQHWSLKNSGVNAHERRKQRIRFILIEELDSRVTINETIAPRIIQRRNELENIN